MSCPLALSFKPCYNAGNLPGRRHREGEHHVHHRSDAAHDALGTQTIFHYRGNVTPPRDYEVWGELIRRLAQHLVERYGLDEVRTWPFEVCNESNLSGFWAGTQDEYFHLYRAAAAAIKAVDSQIRVGGPAAAANQ